MTSPQQSISITQDRVRVAILLYPKDGLTFEEFDNYWVNNHGALFASLAIVKTNLTKYEQVSTILEHVTYHLLTA